MVPYSKLQRGLKDLYSNFKTLKKEIEEDNKNGKIPRANKSEELILWKWLYYQRWYTDSMQSQHQDSIPIHRIDSNFISFQRNRKGNLRIHIQTQ